VGGVDQPGNDVLAHGSQQDAEEPAIATGSAGLKQAEVNLLAFDGALGTGAAFGVTLPEVTISGDESMQAIVLLRIGVDNPAVG
jgi:hypothetical protein